MYNDVTKVNQEEKLLRKITKIWFMIPLLVLVTAIVFISSCNESTATTKPTTTAITNPTTTSSELSGSFNIIGSNTVTPLTSVWAEEFMNMHTKVNIAVSGPGSGAGIILMLVSLALFIVGFTMGGLNYVVTVLQARTRGMTLMRLPFHFIELLHRGCTAESDRLFTVPAKVIVYLAMRNRLQPSAKFGLPRLPMKFRNVARNCQEHFLKHISQVGPIQAGTSNPVTRHGPI